MSEQKVPSLRALVMDMIGIAFGLVMLAVSFWDGPYRQDYAQATYELVLALFLISRSRIDE